MRLLHCDSLQLEEFEGEIIPPYAILSHTWESDEVSFQEITSEQGVQKAGFRKIQQCANQAIKDGWEYLWVDTCCIDKKSSAELSEAINSMFSWYRNASICYVYLSDVPDSGSPEVTYSQLKSSRWFTRGWTLQELLAPRHVAFFSNEWKKLGTKRSLRKILKQITGIPREAVQTCELGLYSIAERMSWAASRETTRIEDIAYSLMGIFGVNMPLLYGEKEKAFIRLQEEIIKSSDDQSIFAWSKEDFLPLTHSGLLAPSPTCFANSGRITSLGPWSGSGAYSSTNKGLRIKLFLIPLAKNEGLYVASLDCSIRGSFNQTPGIYLQCVLGNMDQEMDFKTSEFVRIRTGEMKVLTFADTASGSYRTVYVKQSYTTKQLHPWKSSQIRHFQILNSTDSPVSAYPDELWNTQAELLSSTSSSGKMGGLLLGHPICYVAIFGLSDLGNPWVRLLSAPHRNLPLLYLPYRMTGSEGSTDFIKLDVGGVQQTLMIDIQRSKIYEKTVFLIKIDYGSTE